MADVFDLLKELSTNEELQEQYSDEETRREVLGRYDLTEEQSKLLYEAGDPEREYDERVRSIGVAIDLGYGGEGRHPYKRAVKFPPC